MATSQGRVLVSFYDNGALIAPNSIADGAASTIKALEKSGVLDSNKAAVDYAKASGGKVIKVVGDGVSEGAALIAAENAAQAKAAAEKVFEDAKTELSVAVSDEEKSAAEAKVKAAEDALAALK